MQGHRPASQHRLSRKAATDPCSRAEALMRVRTASETVLAPRSLRQKPTQQQLLSNK